MSSKRKAESKDGRKDRGKGERKDRRKGREPPPIRNKALACLSRREHARSELERKLKDYPPDEIRRTLDALEAESLLSHERFVGDYVRNAERRGYGPVRIRWELKSKQLSNTEIDKGMSTVTVDWDACAQRCYEKKFGAAPPADDEEYHKRRNYLQRRGFQSETIRAVLTAEKQA